MPRLFGEKMRALRRERGMVQRELAAQIGVTGQGHITNLETGKDVPSLDMIMRVAGVFGVMTDFLLRDAVAVANLDAFVLPEHSARDRSPAYFAAHLRALRLGRTLTQAELARQLGATQAYVSNLEAGRKWPSADIVVRAADLFGVTTDALLSAPATSGE